MNGLQTGGIVNIAKGDVFGAQTTGFVSYTRGRVDGFQGSVVVNSAQSIDGVQATVGVNRLGGGIDGTQASVLVNSAWSVDGMQIAVGVNRTRDRVDGTQASAIVNHAGSVSGVQATGLINVVSDSVGVQAAGLMNRARTSLVQTGLINVTQHSTGAQIGLINVAQKQDGVPIGAFSYVKGVPIRLNTWGDETGFTNIGLVSGLPNVYSMLVVGYRSHETPKWWAVGYGVGAHIDRGATFYQVDWVTTAMFNEDDPETDEAISRLRCAVGRQLGNRFAVYAGASLNVWTSSVSGGDSIIPWSLASGEVDKTHINFWPGLYFGLRF